MVSQHGAIVGLHCHPNPYAYLSDNVWIKLSTIIEKSISAMPVIQDHSDWWVYLSLDGFVYHVNMDAANENFTKLKIWIVKEEADTSQTCQAYDQLQAKTEKSCMRPLVDTIDNGTLLHNNSRTLQLCLKGCIGTLQDRGDFYKPIGKLTQCFG